MHPAAPHAASRVLLAVLLLLAPPMPVPAVCARGAAAAVSVPVVRLSSGEAQRIGRRIWENECGGTVEGLTSWNVGENFASLGIGHFIWYPTDVRERFIETFPLFIAHCRRSGVELPDVLRRHAHCPWNTRAAFAAAIDSPEMRELRGFLRETISVQAEFLARRLEEALPKMIEAAPRAGRVRLSTRFGLLAATSSGLYALMDYVNFKGEGTAPGERYEGCGWGLLQVLESMRDVGGPGDAPREFARAARFVLTRRVDHSPPARGERRWLRGWMNRIATYER